MKTKYIFSALLIAVMCCANSVWAATFTGTFQKITSVNDLTTGYYVIAASESTSTSYMFVMGSEVSNNRITGVYNKDLTSSSTIITDPDNTIVYRITKKNNKYTFYSVARSGWLYFDGTNISITVDSASFACTYNSDSPIGFKFSYIYDDTKKIQYNDEKFGFSVYSGNYTTYMTPVRLFKLVKEPDPGSATALDNTETATPATKILRDGRLLILRGNSVFTAQGQKVE